MVLLHNGNRHLCLRVVLRKELSSGSHAGHLLCDPVSE